MKTIHATLAAALVLATASTALANQAKLQGMLRKYAVDLDAVPTLAATLKKAKTPCICLDTVHRDDVGYLVTYFDAAKGRYQAGCYVPVFLADGSLSTVSSCPSYATVGR